MKTVNQFSPNNSVVRQQKNSTNTTERADLEHNIVTNLQNIGKNLINFDPKYEPKIWEKKDRFGNTYYRIYDPMRDRYIYLNSEAEVKCWLDKRYYL